MVAACAVFLSFLVLTASLPLAWLLLYGALSGLCFLVYWRDKRAARIGARRTPEIRLHLLALAGGWPGALLARCLLRHKSAKPAFRVGLVLSVAGNLGLLALCLWLLPDGR